MRVLLIVESFQWTVISHIAAKRDTGRCLILNSIRALEAFNRHIMCLTVWLDVVKQHSIHLSPIFEILDEKLRPVIYPQHKW